MSKIQTASSTPANAETSGVMKQARVELGRIAAAVDRVIEGSRPTMELLEASWAIQNALVSLSNWSGAAGDEPKVARR